MIPLFNSRRKIISLILTAITATIAVLFVSYQIVLKFAYISDNIYFGKSQAAVAQELREELIKMPGCTPITFSTSDKLNLRGFLFTRPNAVGNVLVCHGYKGSKEFMYGFLSIFKEFNVLLFDFRASGESDGSYISLGYHEYKDVLSAVKFLKASTSDQLPFIIMGFSMGGGATLRAASLNPGLANAYIIDSTYSDLRSMFVRGYTLRVGLPYYPFFPVMQAMFHYFANCNVDEVNSVAAVHMINEPIMFIHSCDDNFITPDHSIRLYANAQNDLSRIWIGPKARHGFLHAYHPQAYRRKVMRFLKDTMDIHTTKDA